MGATQGRAKKKTKFLGYWTSGPQSILTNVSLLQREGGGVGQTPFHHPFPLQNIFGRDIFLMNINKCQV